MTEYKDIIKKLNQSQSIRAIQRETEIHRTIIRKHRKKAEKKADCTPDLHYHQESVILNAVIPSLQKIKIP